MFLKIKKLLKQVDLETIQLLFLVRKKVKNKIIGFTILKTDISIDVGTSLLNVLKAEIDQILDQDDIRYIDYIPTLITDDNTIQFISTEEIDIFSEILSSFTSSTQYFDIKNIRNLWAYAIKVGDSGIIAFKKYYPSKILTRKKVTALLYKEGRFDRLNDDILTLEKNFDCIFYQNKIYILNIKNFESIFGYLDKWLVGIKKNINILEEKSIIENFSDFYDMCASDPKKIKKLQKILDNEFKEKINKELVKNVNKDYNLSLSLNEKGELNVNGKNIWAVLRLLDDDHLKSTYSTNKYIAHSKEKR